jgi:hypothetical protein
LEEPINSLKMPAIDCVDDVFNALYEMMLDIKQPDLIRYKRLEEFVHDLMRDTLEECRGPTHKIVKQLIKAENGFVNVRHPKFSIAPYSKEEMTEMLNADHPERQMAEASKDEKKDSLALPFEMPNGEVPRRTSRRPSPMYKRNAKPPGLT